jgi:hypothetical protein
MAGLIIRDAHREWSVAGWVYDHAWTLILRHLRAHRDSEVLRRFRESAHARTRFVSLEGLPDGDLDSFRESVTLAHSDLLKAGQADFQSPEYFEGFRKQMEDLLSLLSSPPSPVQPDIR